MASFEIVTRFMPSEPFSNVKFEIGHVLFIDIVGYSKLLITEQSEQIQKLKEIVRGTEQFKKAEAEGKLLRLPTGDGGALVFRTSAEAPVLCALEIGKELKKHPELRVRMGIHSGPVNEITDLNEKANIAGAGINVAERVMDCGDAGHILLSQHVADDLEQFPRWRPYLHDLGTFEVKHGVRVNVVNLYSDEIGNARLPEKIQAIKKRRAHARWAAVAIGLLLLGAIVGGAFFFSRRPIGSASAVADKSIAVLPFENRSEEKQNEYFADGVQDEILTYLAKIADLKVISRTSVLQYKSGVARNQSEIAKAIADQLQARLSPDEKAAIEQRPTSDLAAFDLYIRAKNLIVKRADKSDLLQAIELLNQAVARDPSFLQAYCELVDAHDLLYFYGLDHTPARLALADAALEAASRIRPDAGDTHVARAQNLYHGYLDYDGALAELEMARRTLPNSPRVFELTGYVKRRQGKLEEAAKNLERAFELDPRNIDMLGQIAVTYGFLRRYPEAAAAYDRALSIKPDDVDAKIERAYVEFDWKADTRPLHQAIDSIRAEHPGEIRGIRISSWLACALAERDA